MCHLSLVRSHLGYTTQVWAPPVERIHSWTVTERIQCRATNKYILNLPFLCKESYKDRLIKLNLLSVSCWSSRGCFSSTQWSRIWNALAHDIGLSVTISLSLFKAHLLSYITISSLCKSMTVKILAHSSLSAQVATKPVLW